MRGRKHPSDLADELRAWVEPLIPVHPGGRPRTADPRDIVDAIFYVLRTGCRWRFPPTDFPPESTARRYFDEWRHNGTPEAIRDALRARVRKRGGTKRTPSAGSIDSQSVPATEGGEARGAGPHKRAEGRKRPIVVDTPGLLLAVAVTAAGADGGAAAPPAPGRLGRDEFPQRRRLRADNACHNHALPGGWDESAP